MTVSHAAVYVGRTLWSNHNIAAAIPAALAAHLDVMDQRHLRMLLRHAIIPLTTHCPVEFRPAWLLPVFSVLMPSMYNTLGQQWSRLGQTGTYATSAGSEVVRGRGADDSQQQQQQQPAQQQQQKLSDEVVTDTILRELTREYFTLLVKVCPPPDRSYPFLMPPSTSGANAGSSAGSVGSAVASGQSSFGFLMSGQTATADGSMSRSSSDGGAGLGTSVALGGNRAAEEESVLETLWRHDVKAVQAIAGIAVAAMCWPDAQSASKASNVCRWVEFVSNQQSDQSACIYTAYFCSCVLLFLMLPCLI